MDASRRDWWYWIGLAVALTVGIGLRVGWVARPLDYRLVHPWRECDYEQIARNFYRGDMNLFFPQIDWRDDTPGYVESELPVIPWLGAALYRAFGHHVQLTRGVSVAFSLATMLLFFRLAIELPTRAAALFAMITFALNPFMVRLGSSLQPEPAMLFFSLLAIYLLWKWERNPTFGLLLAACAAAAFAIMAKATAAYLGFVFVWSVLRIQGRQAFLDWRSWVAAFVAIAPPVAWTLWARHFWIEYGNSLGVSNETHFLTWKCLFPPTFLIGNLKWELLGVWGPVGWLLGLAALWYPHPLREKLVVWYGSVCLFYLVAANTSGDFWASYYHCSSVAPACLLMGLGLAAGIPKIKLAERWARLPVLQSLFAIVLVGATVTCLAAATAVLIHRRETRPSERMMYECAREFQRHVPVGAKIVVRGGAGEDELGQPVAGDEPMLFAWMDRQGFNYRPEDLSVATLEAIAGKGGQYWVARKFEIAMLLTLDRTTEGFEQVAEYGDYALFRLAPRVHNE